MRYLILSDIHGNWEALAAVLADAAGQYDAVVNCGDLVGYGPDPDRVVEYCRAHCRAAVRGNHDKAVAGLADMDWFNAVARKAATWSRQTMKPENLAYLASLEQGPVECDGFSVMHGSPRDEDDYILSPEEARAAAAEALTGLSFFGHTHIQGGFIVHRNGLREILGGELRVEETSTYLINPGSVGQPRDGDPRAAFALYDASLRSIEFRRVDYDASATLRKIVEAGLPAVLGQRLFAGR